jgi:hypothetical protein
MRDTGVAFSVEFGDIVPMEKLIPSILTIAFLGCGSHPAIYETPWFCALLEANTEVVIEKVRAHRADHSAKMARAVMIKDDARDCWGPAALFLGARLEPKAFVLIDKRLIQLTAQETHGRALTEVDPLMVGLALTARRSSGAAERAVGRLVEMGAPKWWTIQDPTEYSSPQAQLDAARVRARSALHALPYTGSAKAVVVLREMRDDVEVLYQLGDGARALLTDLIRQTRRREK